MKDDTLTCPFCGGEVRITVCDDEGNWHPDEYENDPWSGLGFHLTHEERDVPNGKTCPIATFDEDCNSLGTLHYDSREEAIKVWNQYIDNSFHIEVFLDNPNPPIPSCNSFATITPEFIEKACAQIRNWTEKQKKYPVITLCGSTRFKDKFFELQKKLTLDGYIVIIPGVFGHAGDIVSEDEKLMLDEMHKRKIDMADEIFVINVNGYIGSSTQSEIEYAKQGGKKITYLEEVQ